ncbi:DNA-binding domain-containing protein [Leptospira sp. GIMC2001]|uniref:HU family DNA-binding protein n=1 Tax=Leptospira sp. GIMC2001 TaxID=1513297 RepID=UPI00234BC138|nr:DNA-binding domain-containing protein [Leptospira sp. GIMC2001]WCL51255.1 hypothetical protein O4O04_10730 [Leptospira sp. GIMC2001]
MNEGKNLLKYYLFKNKLSTAVASPYLPKTVFSGSLSGSSLIQAVCKGSTITSSDCLAVLENLNIVIAENLSQGRTVNLGFVNFKPTVKGSFSSPAEPFSSEKHQIKVSVSAAGDLVRRVNLNASTARITAVKAEPIITSWANLSLEGIESFLVGHLVEFRGAKLKFTKTDTNQGIFFVRSDGTEIRATEYSGIGGNAIGCKIPEGLEPGESVSVEARALFGSVIRTGKFDDLILIQ